MASALLQNSFNGVNPISTGTEPTKSGDSAIKTFLIRTKILLDSSLNAFIDPLNVVGMTFLNLKSLT